MKTRSILSIVVALATHGVVQGQQPVPMAEPVFDTVWSTINESFYDEDFGGLDWAAFRDHYKPEALAATTRGELNNVMNTMLNALKHSHLRVLDSEGGIAGVDVEAGIAVPDLQMAVIEGDFFVRSTDSHELEVGDKILEVDGIKTETLAKNLSEAGFSANTQVFYCGYILEAALSGNPSSRVKVVVERDGDEHIAHLSRKLRTDVEWVPLPGLPAAQPVITDLRFLPDGIALVRFSLFAPGIMPQIRSFIQNLPRDCPGLIIDLRDNPGGTGLMAPGLLGMLVEENKPCGRLILRSGELNFNAYAQSHAYLGKVAVLVNARSASTSEFFASAVQDNARGLVIGEQTAGMALASLFKPLPNGSSLQYVIANYERANYTLIEGVGVTPDILTPWEPETLAEGKDPAMEAAIAYIKDAMPESEGETDTMESEEAVEEESSDEITFDVFE